MADWSFQLYSARNFPPLAQTLQLLAKTGYRQVEGYGGLYPQLEELQQALQASGLTMGSRCGLGGTRRSQSAALDQ